MQRQVVYCDACQAPDLEAGYAVITVSGDRSAAIKQRVPGNRNTLDLCDACVASLAAWIAERGTPAPVAPPPIEADVPEHDEDHEGSDA